MTLPKQVEETAALAEELHSKMFAPVEENEQEEETQQEEQEESTQEVEPVVEQEEQDEEDQKYQAKYNTLKGKYDAEVPRLHSELKELKQMVFERLGNLTQEPKKEEPPDARLEKLNKFKEEYGEDFLEMGRLIAQLEAEKLIGERVSKLDQHVSSVEETQIQAAQQNFVGYLDDKMKDDAGNTKDWRALWEGKDEKFNEFLGKVEPNSGFKYVDIIRHHNDNWNADGMVSVFNAYYATQAKPQKQQSQPNPAKDAMVAPSRQTHTTPPVKNERIWTRDAMEEFQRNDRAGKYTPEESAALWDDLLKAPAENRMR